MRRLAIALAATLLLPGCGLKLNTTPVAHHTTMATPAPATGQLHLSFKGLAAYKTLATTRDIDHVSVQLFAADGASQSHDFSSLQLRQPEVVADFNGVAVGPVSIDVQAFDAVGTQIGDGTGGTYVQANQTAEAPITVALVPDGQTGNVNVAIDFVDGDPTPAPVPCYITYATGNGPLDELAVRPCAPGIEEPPVPQPIAIGEPAPLPSYPPVARLSFSQLDADGDGSVSWTEFFTANDHVPLPGMKDHLYNAFRQLDLNGNGTLEPAEVDANGNPGL